MEKAEARREAGRRIKALSDDERSEKSGAACRNLLEMPELREARAVLLYAPLPDEVDVWPALHALAGAGKRIVLPKCRSDTHDILCIEVKDLEQDLARGTFGILEPREPRSCDGVDAAGLDVVVTPGRAFDREGNRVGRGAGYYDRLFARPGFRAFKCAVAFDCQVFPEVPSTPKDIPVDAVVTESGVVRMGSRFGSQSQQ